MKPYPIATIPGDGIGKEVVPAGQQVVGGTATTSQVSVVVCASMGAPRVPVPQAA